MTDDRELLPLHDLAVTYSGDEQPHHVGAVYNPFGLAIWFNIASMASVLVSKKYVLTGPLVLRALRTRGLFNEEERQDMYRHAAEVPRTGEFMKDCLRLLLVGQPFGGIDVPLLLRPNQVNEAMYLTRRV